MVRWLLAGLFAILFVLSGVKYSQALTISSTSADYSVLPGGIGEATITVENETQTDREYQVQFVGVAFDETSGAPVFSPLSAEVAAMVSASPASLTLRPGDSLDVTLRFAAPPAASAAEYTYAAIFVERMSVESGVSVGAGYAVMLFARIGVEGTEAYQIVRFETPKPSTTSLPIQFGVALKNAGDRTVSPDLYLQIRRPGTKKVVAEIPINPYGQRLPVATSRIFLTSWGDDQDKTDWDSLMNIFKTPYGAFEAVIVSGDQKLVDSSNPVIHFTVYPLHLLFVVSVPLAVVIFGILLIRALKKRATA